MSTIGSAVTAPTVDWIDTDEMWEDPYPTYRRLRAEAPVAYSPGLGRYLVSTYQDCVDVEADQQTFSCFENAERSLMIRAMGRPLVRRDDPDHRVERSAISVALRPKTIKDAWAAVFAENAERHIRRLRDVGPGADLFHEFAIPFAADNLAAVLGLRDVDAATIMRWSHALVAGTGNIGDDPALWDAAAVASDEIDDAIEASIAARTIDDPPSMIAGMADASDVAWDSLRANVKLTIAGGMNEPSHVISCGVWAVLADPRQRALLDSGRVGYGELFNEAARFVSPVGMYPRLVTTETRIRDVVIPEGATVALLIASANRDETRFADPEVFTLDRVATRNLAFGSGTHVCAGNMVARAMVSGVAFPRLFDAFPALRLADPDGVRFAGWVFRGTTALDVEW